MKIRKQLQYFIQIGIITVLIDYLVYNFSKKVFFNVTDAKALGFLAGTGFSFFANRNYTFNSLHNILGSLFKFVLLYTATLLINVFINNEVLISQFYCKYKSLLAFSAATIISALLNFLGMRYFVFKK